MNLFDDAQRERMEELNDELEEMRRSGELDREAEELESWLY